MTEVPEGARMEPDLDCVLITFTGSYCSQLVRLVACEKGIKWKNYNINIHTSTDNYTPWYLTRNPKGYVPTMLIGDNEPVCESAVISRHIAEKFEGNKLLNPDNEKETKRF